MMDNNHTKHRGFTLIELMIVVNIIGILSVIAIPSFQKYKTNAKMAEAYVIMGNLINMQKSHFVENGFFVPLTPSHLVNPNGNKANFGTYIDFESEIGSLGWQQLAALPTSQDSQVYFAYMVYAGQTDSAGAEVARWGDGASRGFTSLGDNGFFGEQIIDNDATQCADMTSITIEDLGIQSGIAEYNWAMVSATANLDGINFDEVEEDAPSECTHAMQIIEHYNGGFSQTPVITFSKGN